MPLFYLFWRCVAGNNAAAGGVWALLAGSIIALIQFFLGDLVDPGGFGFSRWVSGCVDIVVLPALAPLLVYFFLINFKIIMGTADFTNFALLWLIPGGAIRAMIWSSLGDPILLVLTPILWTAIAVGIPFFMNLILTSKRWVIVPASLGMLIIPFTAASSYWSFYSQKTTPGFLYLMAAVIPAFISMILPFMEAGEQA